MITSARNVFAGTVANIDRGAVNAEITIMLKGETPITSIITSKSVDTLGLKEGSVAYAIIKSSSIIICQELHDARLSARNIMPGIIRKVIDGAVSTEVDIEIAGGNIISSVITKGSSEKLSLNEGDHACAAFKASSVILGVN
ncbi:MAG: TOBE domain-containing protein [Chlorobiaceae bacterium]